MMMMGRAQEQGGREGGISSASFDTKDNKIKPLDWLLPMQNESEETFYFPMVHHVGSRFRH